jgi:hypothetical protein
LNGFVKNRKFSPHEKIKKSKRFFDFLALVVELGKIFSKFLLKDSKTMLVGAISPV